MKRRILQHDLFRSLQPLMLDALPPDLVHYAAELRLLSSVPFSYLLADISQLPPESLRFFYLDVNWLEALTDGAFSIGRVCVSDGDFDRAASPVIISESDNERLHPRLSVMHDNHKDNLEQGSLQQDNNLHQDNRLSYKDGPQTGYIMRSQLVRRMKGLETEGYDGEKKLDILRFDTLSDDIIICIFDGELTRFIISEPKTGLRFGYATSNGTITLKSLADTDDSFGVPLPDKTVNLFDPKHKFVNEKGRLDAASLTRHMGTLLDAPADASLFAFEMISIAQRVVFYKGVSDA